MFQPNGIFARRVLLVGLMAAAVPVMAQESAILGQHWPAAKDKSLLPGWHAYVTVKDGVKYVQINDGAGQPRTAVATANGQAMPLPIGSDSARTTSALQSQSATTASPGQTVYDDGTVSIKATTSSTGVTSFHAVANDCDINHCSHQQAL